MRPSGFFVGFVTVYSCGGSVGISPFFLPRHTPSL
jgi:hypothetical protein